MKKQTLPRFIIVLLLVLFFDSDYCGLLLATARPDVHYCEARETVEHCSQPECYNLCIRKYAHAELGYTSGFCYNTHICDCFYYDYDPNCNAPKNP
ncbi:hypothetical protein HN873_011508 [Arachis hypogaea]|nr:uncharacterized protein DS421_4g110860 [Arachis hypogaea]